MSELVIVECGGGKGKGVMLVRDEERVGGINRRVSELY